MHTLTDISRNKGNQTMNFGQLIEYNMRNIFAEKSYKKCGGESISRHFSKKSKSRRSLDQQSKVSYSLIFLMPSWVLSKHMLLLLIKLF